MGVSENGVSPSIALLFDDENHDDIRLYKRANFRGPPSQSSNLSISCARPKYAGVHVKSLPQLDDTPEVWRVNCKAVSMVGRLRLHD